MATAHECMALLVIAFSDTENSKAPLAARLFFHHLIVKFIYLALTILA